MEGKMRGVTLVADWEPKEGFRLGPKDIDKNRHILVARYGKIRGLRFASTIFQSQGRVKYWFRLRPVVFVEVMCTWHSPMRMDISIIRV